MRFRKSYFKAVFTPYPTLLGHATTRRLSTCAAALTASKCSRHSRLKGERDALPQLSGGPAAVAERLSRKTRIALLATEQEVERLCGTSFAD